MKKTLGVVVVAMLAALLPAGTALAAPTIQFLNPSPYTLTQVPEISDKGPRQVHMVAWVGDVPPSPLVEFEIRAVQSQLPGQGVATIDASQVGSDTWEGFFTIPDTFADGQYTLEARLYSSLEEVANASQIVTVNQSEVPPPAASETVEIAQPENGQAAGFFTPEGKRTNTIINAVATPTTQQVRALYTMSDPGSKPQWVPCGAARPNSNGIVAVRCTLKEGDSPLQVTALAAVANQTPAPAEPEATADEAGDAHRVSPYIQSPASIALTPESVRAKTRECQLMTATMLDQFSRVVAGANIDVHAEGPDDQLTFATDDRGTGAIVANTSDYQTPDKSHISKEPTIRCSDPSRTSGKEQGVHRTPGPPDRHHTESVAGTDNNGAFTFALFSATAGATNVTVWADLNDDDSQSLSEASGAGQIGWDQDPPPPRRQIFIDPDGATADTGDCQALTLVAREGGNALPSVNVDVHITGPDATVAFCTPTGGSASQRAPDQGEHVEGAHTDTGAKHLEGETDTSGRFVFGVTSPTDGRTDVFAWLDEGDDDVFTPAEPSAPATVTFGVQGERSISLQSSKNRARRGERVRLSGSIDGSDPCEGGQTVKLKARRPGAGRFRTIASRSTSSAGAFSFQVRVRSSRDYRAIAPRNGPCLTAKSRIVTVRVRG